MAGARFRNPGPTRCSIIRDSYGIAEENFVAPAFRRLTGARLARSTLAEIRRQSENEAENEDEKA
jgi:hypothetical protein